MTEIYEKDFGAKPQVVACHAGLECGIIGANYPKMETVSFGLLLKERTLQTKEQAFPQPKNSGIFTRNS